jgi:hypothetical protein
MAYLLRMDGGRRTLMNGTGSLLLMGDGDAPVGVGPRIGLTWREWNNNISYRDGGPVVGRMVYSAHAADPAGGIWWTTRAGTLIDYTGYTFTAKITAGGTTVLTKTTGITGSAGSGTNPTGTPNIVIEWGDDELDVTPGDYYLELTPRISGRNRNPIKIPVRIEASAP